MTFHADAVADLLGLDDATDSDSKMAQQGADHQAEPQRPEPSSPTSLLPSGSAGPSSGREYSASHTGAEGSVSHSGKGGKRKTTEKPQSNFPQSVAGAAVRLTCSESGIGIKGQQAKFRNL